jgi:hypothetical protein
MNRSYLPTGGTGGGLGGNGQEAAPGSAELAWAVMGFLASVLPY